MKNDILSFHSITNVLRHSLHFGSIFHILLFSELTIKILYYISYLVVFFKKSLFPVMTEWYQLRQIDPISFS